ncbi:unnamed protein product [Arctogadus glacialis]
MGWLRRGEGVWILAKGLRPNILHVRQQPDAAALLWCPGPAAGPLELRGEPTPGPRPRGRWGKLDGPLEVVVGVPGQQKGHIQHLVRELRKQREGFALEWMNRDQEKDQ